MHKTSHQVGSQAFKIITQYGDMLVVRQGIQHQPQQEAAQQPAGQAQQQQQQQPPHSSRPVIMTFHDLGLNSELQFARFCECDEVKLMLQTFTMIHVNFIGQEFSQTGAGSGQQQASCENLPADFKYPNIDQMAESIVDICTQLRVRSFIALAVGAGAHIVATLALIRPDLVDGLFLINPVIASCSITEWLYFKMSAIASNHHIQAGHLDNHHCDPEAAHESPKRAPAGGGLRRLLNKAHLHLPSQYHQHHHHQQHYSESAAQEQGDSSNSTPEHSSQSDQSGPGEAKQAQSSRLRKLILSRNFRMASPHQPNKGPASDQSGLSRTSSTSSTYSDAQQPKQGSADEGSGDEANKSHPHKVKRPPLEYLMYHHFGPASFQRYRRSSDTPLALKTADSADSHTSQQLSGSPSISQTKQANRADDTDSLGSGKGDRSSWSNRKSGHRPPERTCSRSSDSLVSAASRNRSGSMSLSQSQLAAFGANDRQRQAYMQSVYKHYFCQVNGHNLWLFAHSFAKRKSLNLRKDCGAAAHAAAAAAALGTSICTAFVGLAPAPAPANQANLSAEATIKSTGDKTIPAATIGSENSQPQAAPVKKALFKRQESRDTLNSEAGGHQQAVVAGTKVKRTFTCQTLIMCSSVQMHCERAFKLMSLLNPLQATWIKTDQLLVLDEKPEKVCQALRLFLQGIGYSMSTYERRLRLSSATGSASSADSNGSSSARSFA